jgi:hypothetical protein
VFRVLRGCLLVAAALFIVALAATSTALATVTQHPKGRLVLSPPLEASFRTVLTVPTTLPASGSEDRRLYNYIKSKGFQDPLWTLRAGQAHGLEVPTMMALVSRETTNGANVWGHDAVQTGGCYAKGAGVTFAAYHCYERFRDSGGRHSNMQGVGPTQLTWWQFQNRADSYGGAHLKYSNLYTGAEILRGYYDGASGTNDQRIWEAYRRYHGSSAYANDAMSRRRTFANGLAHYTNSY